MRVLFVNHVGVLGGAEHSLLTLLRGLPPDIEPALASPPGPLHDRARELGVPAFEIPGTTASFRLDPVQTPRALAEMARSAGAVRRLARGVGAELIHANSVRSGLISSLAGQTSGPPVITHVRDFLPPGRASRVVRLAVRRGSQRTICISAHVKRAFAPDDALSVVVPNGVALHAFDPAAHDRGSARSELGISEDEQVLGVIAQLTPWKGQDDAIEMLALMRETHPRARLLVVGETKFTNPGSRVDNRSYAHQLREQVDRLGLADHVRFLGEREDVAAVLAALDVVLVPSWEEPFGRTVIEGMSMERAVVATAVGGPAEIIEPGRTGVLAAPRDPVGWAGAVGELLEDDANRAVIGRAARAALKGRFDQDTHVEAVVALYRAAVAR